MHSRGYRVWFVCSGVLICSCLVGGKHRVSEQEELFLKAAWVGDVRALRSCTARAVDVEARDRRGRTAMHLAAMRGHLEIMCILLERDASAQARDNKFMTPLHVAAEAGKSEAVEFLAQEAKVPLTPADSFGMTALDKAARSGHLDAVTVLLEHGANPCHSANPDGLTALHYAARSGNERLLASLALKGVSPCSQTKSGRTPLHIAAAAGNISVVEELLALSNYRAELINACDAAGNTALHYARQKGHSDIEQLLFGCMAATAPGRKAFTSSCTELVLESSGLRAFLLACGAGRRRSSGGSASSWSSLGGNKNCNEVDVCR